jgi:hypothetical protein
MKNRNSSAPKILRRLPRHQHLSELSLAYEGSSETLRIHPPNISTTGMFINTNVSFPEGSILKLSFRLARTGARIAVRCEVRYCLTGAGVGVEFVDLPPECARAIEAEIGSPNGPRRPSRPSKRVRHSTK